MSGGQQQMLAIGRAIMSRPQLLLLDEPSLGLAPFHVRDIFYTLVELKNLGITIVLVEQNAHLALKVSGYAFVLDTGKITIEGQSEELLNNEELKNAYLEKKQKIKKWEGA